MSEIKFIELKCQRCGGGLEENGGTYVCTSCGKKWLKETMHDFTDMLEACEQAIQSQRIADIAKLRRLLWKETHNEYVSNVKVSEYCTDILKYLPEDFYADFYLATCGKNKAALADFLYAMDADERYDDIPLVLDYILKALKPEWAMGVSNFIEKIKDIDTALYHKYRTRFEEECKKLDDCVFTADFPRDVFVAYSSADMAQVSRLVSVLEAEKLTCFVAARNMRHGSGSVDSYNDIIHTAINNCQVLVFVSSDNSRSNKCDAYKELSYIRENRKDMPRVEYIIKNYSGRAAELFFKKFFEGHEYCTSPKDVAVRATDTIMNQRVMSAPEPVQTQVPRQSGLEQKNIELQQQIEEERRKAKELELKIVQAERARLEAESKRREKEEERRRREETERMAKSEAEAKEEAERKLQEEQRRKRREEAEAKNPIANLGIYRDIGGGYITFGTYPKRKKTDNVKIGEIFDKERGYYLGSDNRLYAEWKGEYFKIEPIRWKVLLYGSEQFIVSDIILDAYRFDIYSNNYANSEIRSWLNGEFYKKAFTEVQKSKIITTNVDNSLSSTGDSTNKNICNDTNDKIFLLSYKEAERYLNSEEARKRIPSEYAIARGAYQDSYNNNYCNRDSKCWWWLRSPDYHNSNNARSVYNGGFLRDYISENSGGIVPALKIKV